VIEQAAETRLRACHTWHNEVISDVVMDKPRAIKLGDAEDATFVTPDLDLPLDFAIIRPGNRGYLLTLGEYMTGTICLDGSERDIGEFVRRGGEGEVSTGFRATPIGPGDWGLISLDAAGDHKIFFQFVAAERPLAKRNWSVPELIPPAIAFSVLLHVALLLNPCGTRDHADDMVWPNRASLTGDYLITRLAVTSPPEPLKEPEKKVATAAAAAPKNGEVKNVKSAAKNPEGAAGGAGETPRARDPNARDDEPPAPPRVGLFTDKSRKVLDNMMNADLKIPSGNFTGVRGNTLTPGSLGFGAGKGTGVGGETGTGTTRGSTGKGAGGGGNVDGDYVSTKGPINTGETRTARGTGGTGLAPKEISIKVGDPTGDFSGLTKDEIEKVVRARSGVFRACYQKELNRTPGLSGKLVVNFVIAADGTVKSSKVDGGSSLRNADVESCIKSNVGRLKFPAKGGAIVNYPFIFSQGG
jgi:hypothetical protein